MFKKLIFVAPLVLVLASCEEPAPPGPESISFTRYQPIYLDVGSIDIDDEYKSPMKPPNVEHLIPISPMDAMHAWVKDRLRAVGTGDRSLDVIITDAGVVSSPMQQPSSDLFPSVHNSNRYTARLAVEMRIYGSDDAMSLANVKVAATQSFTIDDKASLDQRRAIFDKMIFALMENINAELEKNIYQYFGNYINYSRGV